MSEQVAKLHKVHDPLGKPYDNYKKKADEDQA